MPIRPVPRSLTTPDLVVLSLLAERAMHGYEVNAELERRQVKDWAAVSRPQVYYSLEKLDRLGLIRAAESAAPPAGPERRVFSTSAAGAAALAEALEREGWTTARERPPFLTWMALSWQARPGVFKRQLQKRRAFLERELVREQETLAGVRREVGHEFHEAVWMIKLMIQQIRGELRWIASVERESPKRALARHVPPTDD
ncbi:MAG TPA: PadR family transcriptional regulator [Vicinamibacterales bacterium]|nr:PadR family transcriptional regulator [Vicinamibacterales bacterium]